MVVAAAAQIFNFKPPAPAFTPRPLSTERWRTDQILGNRIPSPMRSPAKPPLSKPGKHANNLRPHTAQLSPSRPRWGTYGQPSPCEFFDNAGYLACEVGVVSWPLGLIFCGWPLLSGTAFWPFISMSRGAVDEDGKGCLVAQ